MEMSGLGRKAACHREGSANHDAAVRGNAANFLVPLRCTATRCHLSWIVHILTVAPPSLAWYPEGTYALRHGVPRLHGLFGGQSPPSASRRSGSHVSLSYIVMFGHGLVIEVREVL